MDNREDMSVKEFLEAHPYLFYTQDKDWMLSENRTMQEVWNTASGDIVISLAFTEGILSDSELRLATVYCCQRTWKYLDSVSQSKIPAINEEFKHKVNTAEGLNAKNRKILAAYGWQDTAKNYISRAIVESSALSGLKNIQYWVRGSAEGANKALVEWLRSNTKPNFKKEQVEMDNHEELIAYGDALAEVKSLIEKRGEKDKPIYSKITDELTRVKIKMYTVVGQGIVELKQQNDDLRRRLTLTQEANLAYTASCRDQDEMISKWQRRSKEFMQKNDDLQNELALTQKAILEYEARYKVQEEMISILQSRIQELEQRQNLEIVTPDKLAVGDSVVCHSRIDFIENIKTSVGGYKEVTLRLSSGHFYSLFPHDLIVRVLKD